MDIIIVEMNMIDSNSSYQFTFLGCYHTTTGLTAISDIFIILRAVYSSVHLSVISTPLFQT